MSFRSHGVSSYGRHCARAIVIGQNRALFQVFAPCPWPHPTAVLSSKALYSLFGVLGLRLRVAAVHKSPFFTYAMSMILQVKAMFLMGGVLISEAKT